MTPRMVGDVLPYEISVPNDPRSQRISSVSPRRSETTTRRYGDASTLSVEGCLSSARW